MLMAEQLQDRRSCACVRSGEGRCCLRGQPFPAAGRSSGRRILVSNVHLTSINLVHPHKMQSLLVRKKDENSNAIIIAVISAIIGAVLRSLW